MFDSGFVHVLGSLAAVTILLLVCRARKLPLRETLGLYLPNISQAALYGSIFVVLAICGEWALTRLQLNDIEKWNFDLVTTITRIIGACLLAPIAEELIFRGMLFTRISKTRLGVVGAIVIPAIIFTAAHLNQEYIDSFTATVTHLGAVSLQGASFLVLGQMLVDGLFYGWVRHRTNSTILTIALHAAGNTYAVLQRVL